MKHSPALPGMTWHCSLGICCMQYITQVEDFSSIIVPTRANAESLGNPLGKWKKCSELQGEKLFFPLLFSSGLQLMTVSPKGLTSASPGDWPPELGVSKYLQWAEASHLGFGGRDPGLRMEVGGCGFVMLFARGDHCKR